MEVAFTFDDGRKDALVAADIMNKYNIHGTFLLLLVLLMALLKLMLLVKAETI